VEFDGIINIIQQSLTLKKKQLKTDLGKTIFKSPIHGTHA